jgi:MFS family permease
LFTGADAHLSLQTLSTLKAQVDAGTLTPTANQHRLLGLLAQFNSSRATSLSLVTSVGVFITMMIQPIVGMLSDRTRSRWGRRAPWIAAGAVVGAALVALLPVVPTIAVLVIVWSFAQLVVNIAQGPLIATVVDRVPDNRIGGISAVTGLIGYLGAIVGSVLAGSLFAAIGLASYFPIAVVLVLTALSFVLFARDRSSQELAVEPLRVGTFFTSYVRALGDRDYRWAWIAKVLLMVGYGIATVYTVYMLQSYVTPALSATQAARTAPLMQFAGLPAALIGMVVSGRWSDKIGRRKPFVIVASLIMAVSFLIPFAWPTVAGMFLQAVMTGLGFGVFIVVDQALFIDLLPDRESAGRDLGVSTLGGNLGQAIGPVFAGVVVATFGGAYGPVWPVAFVLVLVAAFAVLPIKRVR